MSAAAKFDEYERAYGNTTFQRSDSDNSKLSAGGKCVRWCLIGMNIFFLILGLTIIGLGLYVYNTDVMVAVGGSAKVLPILVLVTGAVVSFISFLGCCSAKQEIRCLLYLYILIIIVVLVLEFILAVVVLTKSNKAREVVKDGWTSMSDADRNSWQSKLDCCGFDTFNVTAGSVCPPKATSSCVDSLEDRFQSAITVLGVALIVVIAYEVFSILFSYCLIRSIRTAKEATFNSNAHASAPVAI